MTTFQEYSPEASWPVLLRHLVLPAAAPAAVIGLYFTPVAWIGCVNRGLLALTVVLISTAAAILTLRVGWKSRRPGRLDSHWWLGSTFILLLPLVLVLGMLG